MVSNLTGLLLAPDQVPGAAYWRRHIREPVRFRSSMETLYNEGIELFLEVGPSPVLLGMGRRCIPNAGDKAAWLPSLRKNRDDWQQLLDSLANLYVRGLDVDWIGFEGDDFAIGPDGPGEKQCRDPLVASDVVDGEAAKIQSGEKPLFRVKPPRNKLHTAGFLESFGQAITNCIGRIVDQGFDDQAQNAPNNRLLEKAQHCLFSAKHCNLDAETSVTDNTRPRETDTTFLIRSFTPKLY